jgi:hypothetical protein
MWPWLLGFPAPRCQRLPMGKQINTGSAARPRRKFERSFVSLAMRPVTQQLSNRILSRDTGGACRQWLPCCLRASGGDGKEFSKRVGISAAGRDDDGGLLCHPGNVVGTLFQRRAGWPSPRDSFGRGSGGQSGGGDEPGAEADGTSAGDCPTCAGGCPVDPAGDPRCCAQRCPVGAGDF